MPVFYQLHLIKKDIELFFAQFLLNSVTKLRIILNGGRNCPILKVQLQNTLTFSLKLCNNLVHDNRFAAASDTSNNLNQVTFIKRPDLLQIMLPLNHVYHYHKIALR